MGAKVLYFAGYRKAGDRYKIEELEKASTFSVGHATIPGLQPDAQATWIFHGNIVQAMVGVCGREAGTVTIPIERGGPHHSAIGSDRMMAAVGTARIMSFKPHLKPAYANRQYQLANAVHDERNLCPVPSASTFDRQTGPISYVYPAFIRINAGSRFLSFPE